MTRRTLQPLRPADTPGGARPAPHGAGALRQPRRAGRRPFAWVSRIADDQGAKNPNPVPDLIRDLFFGSARPRLCGRDRPRHTGQGGKELR